MLLQPHGAKKDALGRWIERVVRPAVRRIQPAVPRLRRPLFGRHRRHDRPRAAAARDLCRAGRRGRDRIPRRAGRLHPVPGQAVPVRDSAAAGGGDHRPHRRGDAQDGRHRPGRAGRRERRPVPGPECHSLRRDAEHRRDVHRPRRARQARARGGRDRRCASTWATARSRKASPSRCCRRPCSASAMRTDSSSTWRTAAASATASSTRRRSACVGALGATKGFDPFANLHVLPVERPAARRQRRPHQGQGAGPFADRRLQHAAGLPRLRLRQRLQPVRAHLFRLRAGRCAVSRDRAGHREPQGPQQPRRDGAARQRRGHQAELRPGPGDPLQRLCRRRHVGRTQSRHSFLDRGARQGAGDCRPASCRAA